MLKKRLGIAALVLIFAFFALFVNLERRVSFSISKFNEQLEISISVTKLGISFNLHGGNSDEYSFVFKDRLTRIDGNRMGSFFLKDAESPMRFTPDSELTLLMTDKECRLTIKLTEKSGKSSPLNGEHTVSYCGQHYLE